MRELWLSKKTGRKRTGTRVSELRKLFEDDITVRSIYEPIQACFAADAAIDIRRKMAELDFDVLGIKEDEAAPVSGYVVATELDGGTCGDARHDFHVSDLISDSTPLIDVLALLRDKDRCFVLAGNMIHGIVTRADLQKPPVRLLLFGLITLLEMHLTYLVRSFYPGESCRNRLTLSRLAEAESLMKQRSERNEKLEIVDCLQFGDKIQLLLKKDELLTLFEFESRKKGQTIFRDVQKIRDKLAHSQDIIFGTTWSNIIDLVEIIEKLIQKSEASIRCD